MNLLKQSERRKEQFDEEAIVLGQDQCKQVGIANTKMGTSNEVKHVILMIMLGIVNESIFYPFRNNYFIHHKCGFYKCLVIGIIFN